MADYAEHMRMVGFLRELYPEVHVSLHAGELAPGLVPPEGLCCHIRLAVEQARADRIGHGADVMYEDRPYDLLKHMADKGVLVEINLTSNQIILGIEGKTHPFATYRKFGVPVALSTDDEGVSRIDLTHELSARSRLRSQLCRPQGAGAQQSRVQLPAGAEPVGRQRRLCALRRRLSERSSGPGRAVPAMRVLSRREREGGAAMGAGAAFSGVRDRPLSQSNRNKQPDVS